MIMIVFLTVILVYDNNKYSPRLGLLAPAWCSVRDRIPPMTLDKLKEKNRELYQRLRVATLFHSLTTTTLSRCDKHGICIQGVAGYSLFSHSGPYGYDVSKMVERMNH